MRARRATPRRREAPRWSPEEWASANPLLALRWGGRCPRCRQTLAEPVERHHRKRRRDGGDSYAQILCLHAECHRWITEHPEEAQRAGWIVPTWADPGIIPVLVGRGWWLLDELGGAHPLSMSSRVWSTSDALEAHVV